MSSTPKRPDALSHTLKLMQQYGLVPSPCAAATVSNCHVPSLPCCALRWFAVSCNRSMVMMALPLAGALCLGLAYWDAMTEAPGAPSEVRRTLPDGRLVMKDGSIVTPRR